MCERAILWDFRAIKKSSEFLDDNTEPFFKNVVVESDGHGLSAIQYDLDGDMEGIDGWQRENDEDADVATRCVGHLNRTTVNVGLAGISVWGTDRFVDSNQWLGVECVWRLTNPRPLNEEETRKVVKA